MRTEVKSATVKNSTRSALTTKATLREAIVCTGHLLMCLTAICADVIGPSKTLVGIILSAALIYIGGGYAFQTKSNR